MSALLLLLPLIGGILLIGVLLYMIYVTIKSEKHLYSWLILAVLALFTFLTVHSLLKYMNLTSLDLLTK